jgi:predicted transporter
MKKMGRLEAVLWNIAFPGFSQLLSGQYIKGILFVFLEFLINSQSQFNLAIMYSFIGEMERAYSVLNYQWIMFYPCVYMFAIWDAYRFAMPEDEKLSFLPFVFSAYFVTVGIMYSTKMTIFKMNLGPIFLPILFLLPGLISGFLMKYLLLYKSKK